MIHAVSRIPGMRLHTFRNWLWSTAAILPCRKCRSNFRRHIRSKKCDHATTPPMLGICLHREVSLDLKKRTSKTYTAQDLPSPSVANIFQPTFWLAVSSNKTRRKTGPIHKWLKETETLLKSVPGKTYDNAIASLSKLRSGAFGPILVHTREHTRQTHLRSAVLKMLREMKISNIPGQGSISRIRVVTSRSHRASTKRRHTENRKSRSGTRRRSRAVDSRTSSG